MSSQETSTEMNIHQILRLLRNRWRSIAVVMLLSLLLASAVNAITTPIYQASTRLFVSTSSTSSVSDIYQGNRFSQERVVSYTELVKGQTLAQRTIDKLQLEMKATDLQTRVSATSKLDTVLIKVDVRDESPVRARDIANTLSEEFVSMVRELETPRAGEPPDARVIVEQRASIPDKPITPKKLTNLLTGLFLGSVFGLSLALIRDRLDNTVKDENALEQLAGVSVVGAIPQDRKRKESPTINFDSENSPNAEAFRRLRTNLKFLDVDNPPRVIVITSSVPSEGKTTTAINLALSLTEADSSVLLVDGDLRLPRVHQYLGLIGSVGLSSVLSGATPLSEALQETKFDRLTVLAAGPTPPNPSELLGSATALTLLDELRSSFDFVIIDSSPLLAVTDAAVISARADGALLLAKHGTTRKDQVRQSTKNLEQAGAKTLGSILTMQPRGRNAGGYYYREYGYGYGSGPDNVEQRFRGRSIWRKMFPQPND
jgi:capsular exopolysaccharide synthesis family protein